MNMRRAQSGLTLVVSLIMLIVLTLLVVSAIRFSSINLRIAGNVQNQAEGAAAAQVAIEQVIVGAAAGTTNLSSLMDQDTTVSTGGKTYAVRVKKPKCNMTRTVDQAALHPQTNTADRLCFTDGNFEPQVLADGTMRPGPSACNDQMWDISAALINEDSGTSVTMLQGVSLRVGPEVLCAP